MPTGVSRVGAKYSTTAEHRRRRPARRCRRRHRRYGHRQAPGPQRRRRLQLLDQRPHACGATRTATARTSRAPSAALDNDFGVVGVAPGARLWAVKILNDDGYGLLSWYVCGLDWILRPARPERLDPPAHRGRQHERHQVGLRRPRLRHRQRRHPPPGDLPRRRGRHHGRGRGRQRQRQRRQARPGLLQRGHHGVAPWPTRTASPAASAGRAATRGAPTTRTTRSPTSATTAATSTSSRPGKCIWSTKPGNTYGYSSGTSMAAPARDRCRGALQGDATQGHPGRGQGSAPVPGQPELEDLHRSRQPPTRSCSTWRASASSGRSASTPRRRPTPRAKRAASSRSR